MNRRDLLATLPAVATARALLAADDAAAARPRLGICTFSCHLHWQAARGRQPGARFFDAPGFLDYARELGADGVQTGVRPGDSATARRIRERVEAVHGYYEGDVTLPGEDRDLAGFETAVRLTREAGATVARSVLLGSRRYETFKTLGEFREFRAQARRRLRLAEPVLKKHRLRLALENHKDQTVAELLEMLREFSSEWIGVNVDTGNNIALLEEPHEVVEALAPFASSAHLKDMAVQPHERGFLLSEVPLGAGFLDLRRIVSALRKASPAIAFHLEMATRDPLLVPCLTPDYWVTFPDRRATVLDPALSRMRAHPPAQPPPRIAGKPPAVQLAEEETNNRTCLEWMRRNIA